ncbi:MAG: DUF3768 domain-containing protein [Pseudoruegeria sp.]
MPDLMKMHPDEIKRQSETNIIAEQNDEFRKHVLVDEKVGRWLFTSTVEAEGLEFKLAVLRAVQSFTEFTEEADPYGTHEMGVIEVLGKKVWWKIDLYDENYVGGSESPADPTKTRRVLTVLFPSDY